MRFKKSKNSKLWGKGYLRVTEKLLKPLTEAKYLNAENADRYRCIMRIFFENYERLHYWMYQEEVYDEMIKDPYFKDYRPEQCQQDLAMLTEWKNLDAMQDTRRVSSIEEFKNKKFRYQMSEYSVEIERLVLRLENLFIEGASLEPTLLERIRLNAGKLAEIDGMNDDEAYSLWNDLNKDFMSLNQNYQDYMRDLNSVKAEEMMRTKAFMVFKDHLTDYLRNFIKSLQRNVGVIEEELKRIDADMRERIIEKITEHELQIPRMDAAISRELIENRVRGRYMSIYEWFVAQDGRENEAARLFDATNDIIRKITRYAVQLSEKNALGANRREEYRKVAEIFLRCSDINEAHRMSAMVFGIERPYHLEGDPERETDSMNCSVYDEKPMSLVIKPRVRTYKEKAKRSAITASTEKKREVRRRMLEKQKKDMDKVSALEKDGRIEFSKLPVIEPDIREILLKWLSDALETADLAAKTENGRPYKLICEDRNKKCVVHCTDGNFTMPEFEIVFQEENKGI